MHCTSVLSALGFAAFFSVACGDGSSIEEPVAKADYFVVNGTAETICLSAKSPFDQSDDVELLVGELDAGEEAQIFSAVEGSGGHARPSNFFGEFKVVSCFDPSVVIYDKVDDDDWVERAGDPPQLVLTVSP